MGRGGCRRLLLASVALFFAAAANAQEFRLAPLDQVSLRVLDWNSIDETVRGWTDLSGEYHLDEAGNLTIPFVGSIAADGKTLVEVGELISQELRQRFALPEAPDATLDFTGVRTVVVGGFVRSPGAVEYRAGMTVRAALALAGGLEELFDPGTSAYRNYISNQGELRILTDRNRRQRAVLARLQAERNDAETITAPPELSDPDGAALISEQSEIMQRRRARLASEREALADQTDLLQAEIESLTQKTAALERQRELSEEALEAAQSLADRGLVNNERIISAENRVISIQNQLLDTSTAILRARQNVSATERELETLVSGWMSDIIDQIQSVEAEAAETGEKITTLLHLLDDDAERLALLENSNRTDAQVIPDPLVTLYRRDESSGSVVAQRSDLDTVIQPGDLVDVQIGDAVSRSETPTPPVLHQSMN